MIERCIRRMKRGDCATCDHREACAAGRWQQAFAFAGAQPAAAPRSAGDSGGFPAFLGEIFKAFERKPGTSKGPVRREVEKTLEPLLAEGDIGIDRIARELGCSRQTLYRRLKAEDVTFEQVLDGLRRRLARRYIERDGVTVKEAAYRLGFSDPASFSRAYKRWTGHSPTARP